MERSRSWMSQPGRLVQKLPLEGAAVRSHVALSRDGQTLAAVDERGMIKVVVG